MNSLIGKKGYVLFGYGEGFTFYDRNGCAEDFFEDSDSLDILTRAVSIEIWYFSQIDEVYSCIKILFKNKIYYIYAKYYSAMDFIGRRVYNGCALILKDCKMESAKILEHLAILMDQLNEDKTIHDINIRDAVLLRDNNIYNLLRLGISKKTGYFIINTENKSLENFIDACMNLNFYKVFAVNKNIFKGGYLVSLEHDFIDNPSKYIDTSSQSVNGRTEAGIVAQEGERVTKPNKIAEGLNDNGRDCDRDYFIKEVLQIRKLIYESDSHKIISQEYYEEAKARLNKLEDDFFYCREKRHTSFKFNSRILNFDYKIINNIQAILAVLIFIFSILAILVFPQH